MSKIIAQPINLVLQDTTITTIAFFTATNSIIAGSNFNIANSGNVSFLSGNFITLKSSFTVIKGGKLKALKIGPIDYSQLFISEVSDADALNNEFIELYNNGNSSVDLTGYKLVMIDASTNVSEYVFDIGTDETGNGSEFVIPAKGFLIIARGNDKATFEMEWNALGSGAAYNNGNSDLLFGTASLKRWRLRANDKTANMDAGTLIDDSDQAVGGTGNRHYQKNMGGPWIQDNFANATPGALDSDQTLPVELASFIAVSGDGNVTLHWTTQSEVNNVRFDIMKSAEKEGEYSKIGEQQGQFNSNELTNYSLIDNFVANGSTYWYKLVDVDLNGVQTEHGPISATPQASSIPITTINSEVPKSYKLYPSYPNPFNPSTKLMFDVPSTYEELAEVKVEVYNSLGQKICSLFNGKVGAGTYSVIWNGTTDSDLSVSGGTYFAVFTSGHYRETVKMTLVK